LDINIEQRTFLRRIDWVFAFIILCLNAVGLTNLFSATHGPLTLGVEPLFTNQLVWIFGGWCVFFLFTLVEYHFVARAAYIFYFANLAAILYVTFFGTTALGAQRWIDLGFMRYQPSETMKMALILVLARELSQKAVPAAGLGLRELFKPLLLILAPVAMVIEQPDLGTAMMLLFIGFSILLFMKVRTSILAIAVTAGLVASPIMWFYGLRDYQKLRIINFISPQNDPRGTGYNSIQSKIAVGSGQLIGKGFRQGTQSQLEFLPERHTDFIYSVLSEEFGFLGSVGTIFLFVILFITGLRVASTARDKMGALIATGVLTYIFWHMTVNMGMVIGLLPIVGVPLPLLSYGGSSMLTTMAGLGLVSSVAYRRYLF